MPPHPREVVVAAPHSADDDLSLPRPPGAIRRFWSRHPRTVDALVVGTALVFTLPFAGADTATPTAAEVGSAIALFLIAGLALLFRRRHGALAFGAALAPAVLLHPSIAPGADLLLACATYALAVYASVRASWIAFAVAVGCVSVSTAAFISLSAVEPGATIASALLRILLVLIGALLGANVGNRRRYLDALIDRSRQLAIERDQQAALASAAERTRIAREMHDIVSHSLTVVVALCEGAVAASSPDRSRQAARAAADTARGALDEMREMLGVLREGSDTGSPIEPLAPVDPAHVVESAQRAGFPVTLENHGATAHAPRAVRFALGRVVQEGVTNAMRHAPHASLIIVMISTETDAIHVRIDNDGATAAGSAGGFGLRGLRERVAHVGGTLEAGPVAPSSWRLVARLPLRGESAERDA